MHDKGLSKGTGSMKLTTHNKLVNVCQYGSVPIRRNPIRRNANPNLNPKTLTPNP